MVKSESTFSRGYDVIPSSAMQGAAAQAQRAPEAGHGE
jgi:hypothetical protein